ncbi:MAG: LLM class F420-dependent oxidoreductase [Acidimicrobiales bacterium]
MKIGVVFPQTEIGADAGAVRGYAEAVSDLGYDHILAYDHVLGADTSVHTGWSGPYDLHSTFHEPFVLFGYLAAVSSLELVTGIIILPQRQSALVAKQAAEVDLLTGGRFRLGVGLGWNQVEYEALGKDFSNRGRRLVEQITLMRRLWTEESVSFEGEFEKVTGAGLAPLPVQRPIPIWFGAGATTHAALRRAGELSDGWFPLIAPGPQLDEALAEIKAAALEAGRDPEAIGMEGTLSAGDGDLDHLAELTGAWREKGATHLSINTMRAGFTRLDDHLAALSAAAEVLFCS